MSDFSYRLRATSWEVWATREEPRKLVYLGEIRRVSTGAYVAHGLKGTTAVGFYTRRDSAKSALVRAWERNRHG